jgi:hypothetical protein
VVHDLNKKVTEAIDNNLKDLVNQDSYHGYNISEQYEALSREVVKACSNLLKKPKTKNQFWFDDANGTVEASLEYRRRCRHDYLSNKNDKTKARYTEAKNQTRKLLLKDGK